MSFTIALAGKGGTGKTTLASLIIGYLRQNGKTPVLAIDADANANLHEALGVEIGETIGHLREKALESIKDLPVGVTKDQYIEYKIHETLVEGEGFDLMTMGRPEGPGCYCYANNLLREILQTLSQNYRYIIIDNEAGMEHLSRRTRLDIDCLLIVSDPSVRGIQAAGRISRLIKELDTRVKEKYLIINRMETPLTPAIKEQIKTEGLELLGTLPEDPQVLRWEENGKPVYHLSDASPFYQSMHELCEKIIPVYHSTVEEG